MVGISFGPLFLGFFILAQLGEIPYRVPELRINVSYSEPQDDHTISIYLDGKLTETTLIQNITSGKHSLKCVKNGFFDYEEEFSFPEQDTVTCQMTKTTFLFISANDVSGNIIDAKIYIDDRFQGMSNSGTYPVGKETHKVKCSKDGYEDFTQSVNVEKHVVVREGSYYNVNCILKPLPGTVVGQEGYIPTPTPIPKPKGFFPGFLAWLVGIFTGLFRK